MSEPAYMAEHIVDVPFSTAIVLDHDEPTLFVTLSARQAAGSAPRWFFEASAPRAIVARGRARTLDARRRLARAEGALAAEGVAPRSGGFHVRLGDLSDRRRADDRIGQLEVGLARDVVGVVLGVRRVVDPVHLRCQLDRHAAAEDPCGHAEESRRP